MDNTQKLLNDLAALQQSIIDAQNKADELQKQIEEQNKKSLLERVEAGSGETYWGIDEFNTVVYRGANLANTYDYKGAAFTTKEQAENYCKAFETFLELRRCEGSEPAMNNKKQYMLGLHTSSILLVVEGYYGLENKLDKLSPCFVSREKAEAAFDKIGKENILHMFKTFHGLV